MKISWKIFKSIEHIWRVGSALCLCWLEIIHIMTDYGVGSCKLYVQWAEELSISGWYAWYLQWRPGKGAKRGQLPGRHCAGGGIWRGKIWNSEIWLLLANWRLHYGQWYFTAPNTPAVLGQHPLTASASWPHQSSACTKKLTLLILLNIHLL